MEDLESKFQAKLDIAFNAYKETCLKITEETEKKANAASTEEEKSKALIYQKEALGKALDDYSNTLKDLHREFMKDYEKTSSSIDNYEARNLENLLKKM